MSSEMRSEDRSEEAVRISFCYIWHVLHFYLFFVPFLWAEVVFH